VALADGFEFKGERYGSLSAIAKAVEPGMPGLVVPAATLPGEFD
jgi:hypothetical protein